MRVGRLGALAVFGVAGLLFATSAATADGRQLRSQTADLPALVVQEQRRVEDRSGTAAALREEIAALAAAQDDPRATRLSEQAEALVPAAGTAALRGPGVTVVLDDAPRGTALTASVDADLLLVHQQDLQAVVNALWAGGAEGIALMDQPIIATSAVRCVGNTLRLQGQLYAPPYEVTAVGDPDALQAALAASPGVVAYRGYESLGLRWQLRTDDDLVVPAWTGPLDLRHADPLRA